MFASASASTFSSASTRGRRKTLRSAAAALAISAMLASGCAFASPTDAAQPATPTPISAQARPDTVYVYTFASNPKDVKLDNSGIVHKISASLSRSSDNAQSQQTREAIAAGEALTDEIVALLQSMGVHAVRTDAPPPAGENALIVEGDLSNIDAGNHRRRMLIGLGAGKSDVTAHVQLLYKPAGGTPQLVQSFDADANSGHAPGIAETAGVGAAAGRVATSAALGGAYHVGAEHSGDTIANDAKKLADHVAKEVAQVGVAQGWIAAAR